MNTDENVTLISGFYNDEKTHIWSSSNAHILIKNSKLKTLIIHCNLAKENTDINIINCNRGKLISDFEICNVNAEEK